MYNIVIYAYILSSTFFDQLIFSKIFEGLTQINILIQLTPIPKQNSDRKFDFDSV